MNNDKLQNKLIPELRFPEFKKDGDWEVKPLDNIVGKFIVPMRDKPKKLDGNIPWCRIEDFDGMYLSKSKSNQGVTKDTIQEMNLKVYPLGTLLVSCSADLGRCAITSEQLITNQTFIGLVPIKALVNTVFLFYVMSNSKDRLNARSSGTTISYLSRQEFEKFEIKLPNPKEQQKIANCLSSLDNLITAETEKLDCLKDHKKGLLQQLFPANGETKPQYRFPEFENDGDWEVKELGALITKNSTKNKELKYSLVESVSNKYGFVNQNEYFENRRVASIDTSNYYVIKKAYFAYNPSRIDIGSLAYKYDDNISIISPLYISFRAKKEFIADIFLLNWFSTEEFLIQMQNSIVGGVRNTLSYNSLVEIKISFPSSIIEQQKIANCLSSVDDLIEAQTIKIEALQKHKKGLMQQLFPNTNNL